MCIVLIVAVRDVASDQEELFSASNIEDGNYELNEYSNVRKEYETGAAFASPGLLFCTYHRPTFSPLLAPFQHNFFSLVYINSLED